MKFVKFIMAFAALFCFSQVICAETFSEESAEVTDSSENYATAPCLIMQGRTITEKQILDCLIGEAVWQEENGTVKETDYDSFKEFTLTYSDSRRDILYIYNDAAHGTSTLEVVYKGENIPDKDEMEKEWLELFSNLEIPLTDYYSLFIDNEDYSNYTYYLQYEGIPIQYEHYCIGGTGNETDFFGQCITVRQNDSGYMIVFGHICQVIDEIEQDDKRVLLEEAEVKEVLKDYFQELTISLADVITYTLLENSFQCKPMYIAIDKGKDMSEEVYDIGYYAAMDVEVSIPGNENIEMVQVEGFIDGVYPFCYYCGIDSIQTAENHIISDRMTEEE